MTAITRRGFLAGTAAACTAGVVAPLLRPQFAFAADAAADHTLVLVMLDGGLDSVSALVPAGDPAYGSARRSTHVEGGIPVDAMFALHPRLSPIADLWRDGLVAAIPATGNPTGTRSHLAEMAVVAEGIGGRSGDGSGWVARHLLTRAGGEPVTLHGVSSGLHPASSLAGHAGSFHIADLADDGLEAWDETRRPTVEQALGDAYATAVPGLAAPAAVAFDALDRLRSSGVTGDEAAGGDDRWEAQLRQAAQLVRAGIGMEAAVLTLSGWDTHRAQGSSEGRLGFLLERLARALATFAADLHDRLDRVTVVVVSEFGRRLEENASGGTDHGKGGLALVLGGGLRGGVHGPWPGVDSDALDGGDLAVATDVRSVFAEVVERRLGNPAVGQVFPGFAPQRIGFT